MSKETRMDAKKELLSADEVIKQISECLTEADGDFLEHIANSVLGRKVRYVEDSIFEYKDENEE